MHANNGTKTISEGNLKWQLSEADDAHVGRRKVIFSNSEQSILQIRQESIDTPSQQSISDLCDDYYDRLQCRLEGLRLRGRKMSAFVALLIVFDDRYQA